MQWNYLTNWLLKNKGKIFKQYTASHKAIDTDTAVLLLVHIYC